jgi:urease accessory protein
LANFISASFPVGAFAYSHGLETAIERGDVKDPEGLWHWLAALIETGSLRNDAILVSQSWHADPDELNELGALTKALAPSFERYQETLLQGQSFAETVNAAHGLAVPMFPLPISFGAAASALGADAVSTCNFYLFGFAANSVQVALRLLPIGQTKGQKLLVDLMPLIEAMGQRVQNLGLDDLGSATLTADLHSLRHETQTVRLFRS